MIRRVFAGLLSVLALTTTYASAASADEQLRLDIELLPYIGDHYLLVDDYLRSSRFGWMYDTGAITGADVFGTFADVDGDGMDDLIWLVDYSLACDDNGERCDLLVFRPVGTASGDGVPSDWEFVEALRVPVKRAMYERFALLSDRVIRLDASNPDIHAWPSEPGGVLNFAKKVYGVPALGSKVELSDVRLGTHDVDHDGQDEVFIYIVSADVCYNGECGGDILKLLPGADGSAPAWRSIGRLPMLDVAEHLLFDALHFHPARYLRTTGRQVEGHDVLCGHNFVMHWSGDAYVVDSRVYCRDED